MSSKGLIGVEEPPSKVAHSHAGKLFLAVRVRPQWLPMDLPTGSLNVFMTKGSLSLTL